MFVALLLFLTAGHCGQCSWLAQPCCLQRFPHQHVGRHPAVWDCTLFGCDVYDTRRWWGLGSVLFLTVSFCNVGSHVQHGASVFHQNLLAEAGSPLALVCTQAVDEVVLLAKLDHPNIIR